MINRLIDYYIYRYTVETRVRNTGWKSSSQESGKIIYLVSSLDVDK